MTFKVQINLTGLWVPANTKYYKKKEDAENHRRWLIRNKFGGNHNIVRVIEVSQSVKYW